MNQKRDELEVYLVGGAVRDELLGREVKDRDWVVVGVHPEDPGKGLRVIERYELRCFQL